MLNLLKLLLPALVPSWRFFDVIAPSPRIEFALLNMKQVRVTQWQEFRPRPARLSFRKIFTRLFWNYEWNECLYMISCAERLLQEPTVHSENEIAMRIVKDISGDIHRKTTGTVTYLQFRLLLIQRVDNRLQQTAVFRSRSQPLDFQAKA